MSRIKLLPILAATLLAAFAGNGGAQEVSKSESPKARPPVNLRVQVVIARFEGEKKVASLPYTFLVTTGSREGTRVRMGVDTPIPMKSNTADGRESTNISYQSIGTNIDCHATDLPDGRYRLELSINNTAALPRAAGAAEGLVPVVRRVDARIDPALRDGQNIQTTVSTDPVTGEVVKIDVTMNVAQ